MEGGDVDCRYEDAYERPWTVAMGGPDNSWAEPGLGTNPLNYTLAYCDIIGMGAVLIFAPLIVWCDLASVGYRLGILLVLLVGQGEEGL